MVERLARGPAWSASSPSPFDFSLPTVVQHLGVLEAAGIVTSTKVGRVRTYQLATEALTPAANGSAGNDFPPSGNSTASAPSSGAKQQGDNEMSDTIERSQTHTTFVIERNYPPP